MGDTLGGGPALQGDSLRRARQARTWRRMGLLVLAAVCVAAMCGFLGPRETSVRASAGGTELTLTHPSVVRPGMEIDFVLEVERNGTTDDLEVVVDQRIFERLGIEKISPEPDAQQAGPDQVVLTFEKPDDPATILLTGRLPTQATPGVVRAALVARTPGDPSDTSLDLTVRVLP